MQYRKAEHGFTLTLHSDIPERKILRWRTELLKSATVAVTAVPMDFTVTCPPLAVCGEKLSLTVQGAELVGMMDRCGVFDETGLSVPICSMHIIRMATSDWSTLPVVPSRCRCGRRE